MKNPSVYAFCFVLFSVVNRSKAVVDLGLSDSTCYDLRTSLAVLHDYESVTLCCDFFIVFINVRLACAVNSWAQAATLSHFVITPDSLCQFWTFPEIWRVPA
jgi:hypothetical protein